MAGWAGGGFKVLVGVVQSCFVTLVSGWIWNIQAMPRLIPKCRRYP